jgi:flagellar hook-associated protein 2
VAQLVAIKRQPIVRMEERKSLYQQQLSAFSDLETKLKALRDAVAALDSSREFGSLNASSSDEDLLTAEASSLANPGSYEITVSALATYQKDVSQGYADLTENVGSGTITFTVDGEAKQVTLANPVNSLADLRDAINDAGAGVYATILNDGSETTPYHLILTSEESGTAAAFTADFSGLNGGTTPVFTNLTAAQNAALTIDTIPVTSATNIVVDAITGLTLNLHNADPAAASTVTVETDSEAITAKIQDLVDVYNDLFAYLASQNEEEGTLRGHSAVRTIKSRLQTLFTFPLPDWTGDFSMFAQIGISQGEGGQLEFDSARFQEALGEDYADVRNLFAANGDQPGKAYLIRTAIDDLIGADGIFKISRSTLNDKIENADDAIARYERSVEAYEAYQLRKFTAMENMIAGLQAQGNYLTANMSRLGL